MQGKKEQIIDRRGPRVPSRTLLSGGSKRVGSSIQGSSGFAGKYPNSPVVNLPVTHLAAGMHIPISQALTARFGIGEAPVDAEFLISIETIFEFLQIGLQQDWISSAAVKQMIQSYACGSSEQAEACFSLVNKCLLAITEAKNAFSDSVHHSLKEFEFIPGNTNDWEFTFGVSDADMGDPYYSSTTPKLTASEYGLCVLVHDLSDMDESLKLAITQFVHFCSQLSQHATSIEMMLDNGTRWMLIGDAADLSQDADKELLSVAHDENAFYACLQKHLGEEFMSDLFCDPQDIADFYISHSEASALANKLEPLTKGNVLNYFNRISENSSIPSWLKAATQLLYKHCDWELNMEDCTEMCGHIPFSYSRPFGFNFPSEMRIFEFLHETSMQGEETSSLSVAIGANTAPILANLELGETLLLFVDEMLNQEK